MKIPLSVIKHVRDEAQVGLSAAREALRWSGGDVTRALHRLAEAHEAEAYAVREATSAHLDICRAALKREGCVAGAIHALKPTSSTFIGLSEDDLKFIESNPRLTSLGIVDSKLTDDHLLRISCIYQLKSLSFEHSIFTLKGFSYLSRLEQLEEFSIIMKNLSIGVINTIIKLTKLRKLRLFSPNLEDDFLERIVLSLSLEELEYLDSDHFDLYHESNIYSVDKLGEIKSSLSLDFLNEQQRERLWGNCSFYEE